MRHEVAASLVVLGALSACGGRTGLVVDEPTPEAGPVDAGRDANDAREAGVDAPVDAPADGVVDDTPRLISPLSTTTVRSHAPTLRWRNPPGVTHAEVFVCATYDCSKTISDSSVSGAERINLALDPGTYFWKVRWGDRVTPTWELVVPKTGGGGVDTSWGTMLDVDADGFADVVARRDTTLEVHPGSLTGPSAAASVIAFSPNNMAPTDISDVGDLNGDGFPEVMVNGLGPDGGEAALVFFGSRAGLSSAPSVILPPEPRADGSWFPATTVAVGDLDADGYGDLLLNLDAARDSRVHAYLFRGSASGISGTPDLELSTTDASLALGGIFGAIDVDGDGRSELFLSAKIIESGSDATLVYRLPATTPLAEFPSGGPVGDFNCDGFGDLALELPGKIEFHRGGPTGLGPPETFKLPIGPSYGGLVSVGDYDGDGCEDALWVDHIGGNLSLWHGDASSFLVPGAPVGFGFVPSRGGRSVALLGDVDGDGRADVAAANRGDVFDVHLSSSTGPSPKAAISLPAWAVASSQ